MDSDRNVAVLEEAYRLWNESKGASTEHWLGLLADELLFHSLGGDSPALRFAGTRKTKEEVVRYFEALVGDWEMEHYTPGTYIAQGEWVAMIGHTKWHSRSTGKPLDTPKADFWRFGEDGKAIEFHEFFDTAVAVVASTPE